MELTVTDLANRVKIRLEAEGVHVHWDDAHTTGSVYLDLDHGILGTIRVSDHKSKGHGFKYDIGDHVRDKHTVVKEFHGVDYRVSKFPADCVGDLTERVMIARLHAKSRVGNRAYEEQVKAHECPQTDVHSKKRRRKSSARSRN